MKKLYVLLLAAGMMFATSQEAKACFGFGRSQQHRHQGQSGGDGQVAPAVGAPLDGGLLIILATAGGAYFVARKKKRNQQ